MKSNAKLTTMNQKFLFVAESSDVAACLHKFSLDKCVYDQPYQRPLVWSLTQKQSFIHSIYQGVPLPAIVFVDWQHSPYRPQFSVVDGKQRCNSIIDYIHDEIPFQGKLFSQEGNEVQRMFLNSPLPTVRVFKNQSISTALSIQDEALVYIMLNTTGTPHLAEDINRAKKVLKRTKLN